MKVRWEPRLREELVRAEARQDATFNDLCLKRLETVYDLPETERGDLFATTYGELFEERHLGKPLEDILAELPVLEDLSEVLVFNTVNFREENAELNRDQTKMGLKLRVARLREPAALEPFMRHELMHVSDMLRPEFGYRYEPSDRVQEHLARRYEVMWDAYIDGRLDRRGHGDAVTREQRQRQFERLFSFLPRRQRAAAFQAIWDADDLTHARIMELAEEPAKVALLGANAKEVSLTPVSGTFCPLCRFPTFEWANPAPAVQQNIRQDFPDWTHEEGICGRCHEYFEARCERDGVTI